MQVYPIDTEVVLIKNGHIEAIVDEILIYDGGHKYNVSWWNGDEKKSAWIRDSECQSGNLPKINIGFNQQ